MDDGNSDPREHEARLHAMRDDGGNTWDLSPNDEAAIAWALAEIESLRASLQAEGRDAERYRWLREEMHMEGRADVTILRADTDWGNAATVVSAAGLDDAIDAAMSAEIAERKA